MNLNWEIEILEIINNLNKTQFKNFCRLFLEATGLSYVNVTEKENKVIGTGTIELGIVLSYHFVFIGVQNNTLLKESIIKELRKLEQNQTNKGLILTTGQFSRAVKKQAKQKGMLPIDLIDSNNLISRLKALQLGITINSDSNIRIDKNWFDNL